MIVPGRDPMKTPELLRSQSPIYAVEYTNSANSPCSVKSLLGGFGRRVFTH